MIITLQLVFLKIKFTAFRNRSFLFGLAYVFSDIKQTRIAPPFPKTPAE